MQEPNDPATSRGLLRMSTRAAMLATLAIISLFTTVALSANPGLTFDSIHPRGKTLGADIEFNGQAVNATGATSRVGDIELPPGALSFRDDICRVTDLAIVATVLSTKELFVAVGRTTRPRTRVSLFVEAVVRGESRPWVDIVIAGGVINGRRQFGSGQRMHRGERYLLLLRKSDSHGLQIIASGRGAVRLDADKTLPYASALQTTWELACSTPLSVPQHRFAEER